VQQLFDELGVKAHITELDTLKRYQFDNLAIFVGDIFELSTQLLGQVDAVYDRAAFVALPPKMRVAYSSHINQLCQQAPQLLISYEYDQTVMAGPPFASKPQDIADHYGNTYQIDCLLSQQLADGLKGEPAKEYVWHMHTS